MVQVMLEGEEVARNRISDRVAALKAHAAVAEFFVVYLVGRVFNFMQF